jgi:hypothetical protein
MTIKRLHLPFALHDNEGARRSKYLNAKINAAVGLGEEPEPVGPASLHYKPYIPAATQAPTWGKRIRKDTE